MGLWRPSRSVQVSSSVWLPTYSPELYHHGIKGQRWGIRRFRAYPKGYRGSGKEVGLAKKEAAKQDKEYKKKWDHSESALEMNLKRAGSAAVAAGSLALLPILHDPRLLVTAGGMGYSLGTNIAATMKGREFDKRTADLKTDPKTGLKLKDPSKKWSIEDDLKEVNPEFMDALSSGSSHNCVLCTLSLDLRRRGYDVRANRAKDGWDTEDISHWYPKIKFKEENLYSKNMADPSLKNGIDVKMLKTSEPKTTQQRAEYAANTMQMMLDTGKNSRGMLCCHWEDGGGHAMYYEVQKGEVHVYDGQTGSEYKDVPGLLYRTSDARVARLDNIQPDPKTIKEVTHK